MLEAPEHIFNMAKRKLKKKRRQYCNTMYYRLT